MNTFNGSIAQPTINVFNDFVNEKVDSPEYKRVYNHFLAGGNTNYDRSLSNVKTRQLLFSRAEITWHNEDLTAYEMSCEMEESFQNAYLGLFALSLYMKVEINGKTLFVVQGQQSQYGEAHKAYSKDNDTEVAILYQNDGQWWCEIHNSIFFSTHYGQKAAAAAIQAEAWISHVGYEEGQ